MSIESLISEYESRLSRLKNWPDKNVMYELTSFALRNPHISNHIADILISRLIDPSTNKNHKVPLFYLVDSTMKNSGKQFIDLFSSHIAVAFQRVFSEIHDIDKARLDFLLSTWETRAQFPRHLLIEMRSTIGRRIVVEESHRQTPQVGREWPDSYSQSTGLSYGRGAVRNESSGDALKREMEAELQRMLGAQTRFTLDQVKTTNAQLYSQIEKAATEKLEKKKQEAEGPLDGEKFKNRKIGGFINEQPMVFDLGASYDLTMKLCTWDANKISYEGTETLKDASSLASARLTEFLKTLDTPPPLPALIANGHIPDDLLAQKIAEANKAEPKEKLPVPKFRHDLLGRPPKDALKALYIDRSFYCRQDGMRFKSQTELANHLDVLFIRNQDKQRKEGTRTYRQWFCKESQWITDFGSLKRLDIEKNPSSTTNPTIKTESGKPIEIPDEEMVLPADEHFTRCPVSNEAFLPEWDTEEGDYMYRNAVKVLLTEKADKQLYQMNAQPTEYPLIRYIIVHQKLVMDGWLAAGKAASLFESIQRINKRYGTESEIGRVLVSAYATAAGEEEDSNDIFILFEPMERSGEGLSISDHIYQYENSLKQQQQQDSSEPYPSDTAPAPIERETKSEVLESEKSEQQQVWQQEEQEEHKEEDTSNGIENEENAVDRREQQQEDREQEEEDGAAEMKMELQNED